MDIKRQIEAESRKVLQCNLPNLKLATESYLEEIKNRPFESEELTTELFRVIRLYQEKDCRRIPPHLCRRVDESQEQFLDRLYDAHKCKSINWRFI